MLWALTVQVIKETIHYLTLGRRTRHRLEECRNLITSPEESARLEKDTSKKLPEELDQLFSSAKKLKSNKKEQAIELLRKVALEHKMRDHELRFIDELEKTVNDS